MRYQLYTPAWTPFEVEVPDECPHCKADLTVPRALEVWEWSCQINALAEDGMLEPDGETDYESTYSEDIRCRACRTSLAPRAQVTAPFEG